MKFASSCALALLLGAAGTFQLAAQSEAVANAAPTAPSRSPVGSGPEIVYRREVFDYAQGGRRDPFRSLLGTAELGVRLEDLTLVGVVYNPNSRGSLAVFLDNSTQRRIRLRTGERVGGVTVTAIYPRRADVRADEFGVSRSETLYLQARSKQADSARGTQP